MTKEALKLALEALEHEADKGNDDAYKVERDAIKEALAQPEQEPVAWRYRMSVEDGYWVWNYATYIERQKDDRCEPLYTTPRQRTWVGLTDEEVEDFVSALWPVGAGAGKLLRVIEANLKDKNI